MAIRKTNRSKKPSKTLRFWWEVTIHGGINPDALQEALFALGSTGCVEMKDSVTSYFEPSRWPSSSKLLQTISERLGGSVQTSIAKIPARDWESEWKKHFKPRRVAKHFIVRPSWERYQKKKNDVVLIIDPKMSFGTGTHETTQLVLGILERTAVRKKDILDIGTGTGILAIAAVKLGARRAFAFDVDDNAFENATENVGRNRCASKIQVAFSSLDTLPGSWPATYDILLANIQRGVFEQPGMMKDIISRMNPGALLIVSGILSEEDILMKGLFESHDLKILTMLQDGEWMAYQLAKGNA